MENIKFGIIITESNGHEDIIKACKRYSIEYILIDIKKSDWLKKIKSSQITGIIYRSFHSKQYLKDLMDERLYFIYRYLKIPLYPSFEENYIYENKNNMAYWLKIHNVPHVKTFISYDKEESLQYLKQAKYPIVFKTKIGSAGTGVEFINNYKQGKSIVNRVFPKRFLKHQIPSKGYVKKVKGFYKNIFPYILRFKDDSQHGFILFQEKIDIKYEWRIIKLGESYFGHQKLIGSDGKHSGSSKVGWVAPPIKLLNFARNICLKGNFRSMNLDIFEDINGNYYVNELQTMFGSYDNSQMYIDGKPGRYKYTNNEWVFEEGFFNTNRSMDLRVEDFIKLIKEKRYE